jgi:hypothetical protein
MSFTSRLQHYGQYVDSAAAVTVATSIATSVTHVLVLY